MKIMICVFLISLYACSFNGKSIVDYSNIGSMTAQDYADHLASLGPLYLKSDNVVEINLNKETSEYLEQTYERIVSNNEVLLKREIKTNSSEQKNSIFKLLN